jgi:thymidylate kinase
MAIENFYGLEGLDGVGKTTVRETLKNRGCVVLKTPPQSFPIRRELYDDLNVTSRFMFYLMGVILAGNEAKKIAKSEPVLCDRYLLTTIAAHEAMGLSLPVINIMMPILRSIPTPCNTFLLVADEEERIRRMTIRGANQTDIANLRINSKILDGYRKWSLALGHSLEEIDTTNISSHQVAGFVEDEIHSRRG